MSKLKELLWGHLISHIVANLCMEESEIKAHNTASHHPSLWKRFVDDTFVVIQSAHKNSFIQHINSIDQSIQFTVEDPKDRWIHAFFWTLWLYPN